MGHWRLFVDKYERDMRYDTPAEREMQESVLSRFGVVLWKLQCAASKIIKGKMFGDKIFWLYIS